MGIVPKLWLSGLLIVFIVVLVQAEQAPNARPSKFVLSKIIKQQRQRYSRDVSEELAQQQQEQQEQQEQEQEQQEQEQEQQEQEQEQQEEEQEQQEEAETESESEMESSSSLSSFSSEPIVAPLLEAPDAKMNDAEVDSGPPNAGGQLKTSLKNQPENQAGHAGNQETVIGVGGEGGDSSGEAGGSQPFAGSQLKTANNPENQAATPGDQETVLGAGDAGGGDSSGEAGGSPPFSGGQLNEGNNPENQATNAVDQETVIGTGGHSSAEADEAPPIAGVGENQAVIPSGGTSSAEALGDGAAQTIGGDAESGTVVAGGALGGVVHGSTATKVPTEKTPIAADYSSAFSFSSSDYSSGGIGTTVIAKAVTAQLLEVAGDVAPQEAEEESNLAPQEMSDSAKIGIGVGVGVAASAAVAMGAAAVYYSKKKAAAGAASAGGA